MENKLSDFIDELNEGGKYKNALAFDGEENESFTRCEVLFYRNHSEQYARLLRFCADNEIVVCSTHPGTLATVVQIQNETTVVQIQSEDAISRQAVLNIIYNYNKRYSEHIGLPDDSEIYAHARGLLVAIRRNIDSLPLVKPKLEPREDIISRQAAIEAIEFGITYARAINKETGEVKELFQEGNNELRKAAERVKALPTAR